MEKYGIKEEIVANPTEGTRYLVGCDGFLQANRQENGTCTFTRRGVTPWSIFEAIAQEFKVEFVSEHDHRYWGFATEEEWDAWHEQGAKEAEDEFYDNILKYLRGEPNVVLPGTILMIKAEIAKKTRCR